MAIRESLTSVDSTDRRTFSKTRNHRPPNGISSNQVWCSPITSHPSIVCCHIIVHLHLFHHLNALSCFPPILLNQKSRLRMATSWATLRYGRLRTCKFQALGVSIFAKCSLEALGDDSAVEEVEDHHPSGRDLLLSPVMPLLRGEDVEAIPEASDIVE